MKNKLIFVITAVICILVTGCGNREEPSAQVKDQVIIGFQKITTTTNPTDAIDAIHRIFFNLTHDTLVDYDETGHEIKPALASEWSNDDDYKVWNFTLRDDVSFHNGEPFTADDVVFTWEWAKENAGNGMVKSFYKDTIDRIEATDDHHITIYLKEGNIDFLYTYSYEYFSVLNREALSEDPEHGAGIGTGPFQNKEFISGDHTELLRFDDYWKELPPTRTLLFRYIPDGSTRLASLEAGEIDICQAPNNTELDIIRENEDLDLINHEVDSLTYLSFNMKDPVLQDENLRLAIAYAVDTQEIIDGAASGLAQATEGMWGKEEYGYFDDWASENMTPYNPPDLDLAREYLAQSDYPDGGVTIHFAAYSQWTANALQIVQSDLKALNIDVKIDTYDAAGFGDLVSSGEHQATISGLTFTVAGSDAAKIYSEGNSTNYASFSDKKVDELFAKAAVESDDSVRKGYYKDIQTIVHKTCPYVPLYYANTGAAYKKNVSGVVFNPSSEYDYTYVTIEE